MAAIDPYFDSVSLLLHCEGGTLVDSSKYAANPTLSNGAALSGNDCMFGSSSVYFSSRTGNQRIDLPTHAGLLLDGDFTVEFFAKATDGYPQNGYMFSTNGGYNGWYDFHWYVDYLAFPNNSVHSDGFTATATHNNSWHHYAVTRSGTTVYAYIDGVYKGSKSFPSISVDLRGSYNGCFGNIYGGGGGVGWLGYMDEIRITKGVARYTGTGSFSVPTEAFGNSASVVTNVLVPYWIRHRTDGSLITVVAPDGSGGVWALRKTSEYVGGTQVEREYLDRYDAQGTVVSSTYLLLTHGADMGGALTPIYMTISLGAPVGIVITHIPSRTTPGRVVAGSEIVRFDSSGVQLWSTVLLDENDYVDVGAVIGGVAASLLTGRYAEIGSAGSHLYAVTNFSGGVSAYLAVAKLSAANGSISWQRKLTPNTPTYDALIPAGIAAIADGNVYVAVTAQLAGVDKAAIVYKYNSSGTLQWQKTLSTGTDGKCLGLAIDASENVYAAVVSPSTGVVNVVCVATGGTLTWQRNVTFTGQLVEALGGVAWDSTNSKVYVTATVDADHYIMQLSSAGALNWTRKVYRTSGGRDTAGRIKVDTTNNVILLAGSSV